MIGIIDYGMGNIHSVANAFEHLGADAVVVADPAALDDCERFVLPGVGAFNDCMANLHRTGFVEKLDALVNGERRPILGICLGMQVMASRGFENGDTAGLGWFEGDVSLIESRSAAERIPHVGWNELVDRRSSPLLEGIPADADFYFVHSYAMRCRNDADVVARCGFAGGVTAIVSRGNIAATQFHPEKSQGYGLQLLENFLSWTP